MSHAGGVAAKKLLVGADAVNRTPTFFTGVERIHVLAEQRRQDGFATGPLVPKTRDATVGHLVATAIFERAADGRPRPLAHLFSESLALVVLANGPDQFPHEHPVGAVDRATIPGNVASSGPWMIRKGTSAAEWQLLVINAPAMTAIAENICGTMASMKPMMSSIFCFCAALQD
ncbi:MAG: hypothetical protein V4457_04120 [Pseudomonadota bacterium]